MSSAVRLSCLVAVVLVCGSCQQGTVAKPKAAARGAPQEVLFWHFWGGADRDVVDDVVRRFNESQTEYRVRAVPMPGNNLQAKLFLSIAGGDPPDLVNQDDPIVGDWASRGAIQSVEALLPEDDLHRLERWMFPAAVRLSRYRGHWYALCNGLDIRALYVNETALATYGRRPPRTLDELTEMAREITPPGEARHQTFAYLPDSRRLWAWGYVFGGEFLDPATGEPRLDSPAIRAALEWMAGFSRRYGADTINAFRQGDQSLPGKAFPLLPTHPEAMQGRYLMLMDGQWRTRDVRAFLESRERQGLPAPRFSVCPLPPPAGGRRDAGWVNGNFFVIPRNARNPQGAMAFARFWIGLDHPDAAAETCARGGWIPVSQQVVDRPAFQEMLRRQPLFGEFVRLAASENQLPVPVVRGAPFLKRIVEQVAAQGMNDPDAIPDLLRQADARLRAARDREVEPGANTP